MSKSSSSPKDEVMTIAEQLRQQGRDESAQALREAQAAIETAAIEAAKAKAEKHQIALNFLRIGLPIEVVAENTKLDVDTLNKLLQDERNH